MSEGFTHFDKDGNAVMVDVSEKMLHTALLLPQEKSM